MIEYLKALISKDSPERVNAALALLAGISLCIGFIILIIIIIYGHKLQAELATITAGISFASARDLLLGD